eukprot:Gb_24779 [translate_table: standard]
MEKHIPHAVLVPVPAQGHVRPLMNFARILAARGFFITFVTTDPFAGPVFSQNKDFVPPPNPEQLRSLRGFRFLSIRDYVPADYIRLTDSLEYMQALHKLAPAIVRLLRSVEDGVPPITCIVSDCFFAATHEVATALGVPRVVFWTFCATAAIATSNSRLLLSEGYIPVRVKDTKRPEDLITCLPGNIPPLWPTELLAAFRIEDISDAGFQIMLYEADMQSKADYVLVNSFEELEGPETISGLSQGYPALAIGPVFLAESLTDNTGAAVTVAASSWKEDLECLKWLDTQAPGSVLYVSFGSLVTMSNLQLQELALGLKASQQPFLWALRPDAAEDKPAVLPEGFVEDTRGRGVVVEWTPQRKVLSHPSVGGFMTHCGWNSTLESIAFGVPIIGWPVRDDQFLNCRFAKEIWKMGMDFGSRCEDENVLVMRDEVEKVVRDLMQGPHGKELRNNALKLKESATKAVMPGGSSFKNLDKFEEDMRRREHYI